MNPSMIKHVMLKDIYFSRLILCLFVPTGFLSLAMIYFGNEMGFYIGSTLLITVVVGSGVFLIFETVINERKYHTLQFLMSLPITPLQYLRAKLWGNLLLFLVPWTVLTAATVAVIFTRSGIPNGLLPLATLVLVELLTAHCVILAIAMITESQGWTIAIMVVCNLFLQVFLYTVSNHAGIKPYTEGLEPVWSGAFFTFLGVLIAVAVAVLSLAFWIQTRKKDFL